MSSFSSTTTFSMSSFTTIPAATAKQPYLASPYLSSPFAPSTPLNYSPTQPSTAASTSSALHMLDARTDDEVFDLAFHPTQPLLVAGLITGELQLYRLDGKLEAPSKSTAGTGLKSVKEEDEDEDEEDDEIGGEDESGSSFDESGEEDEEAVLFEAVLPGCADAVVDVVPAHRLHPLHRLLQRRHASLHRIVPTTP